MADIKATGVESISAALQLWDLCEPEDTGSIEVADLEQVLTQHIGASHNVTAALRPLLDESGESSLGNGRTDFISYWQCIDQFFRDLSRAGKSPRLSTEDDGETDTIKGMRRFRDGVLDLWHHQGSPMKGVDMKALLGDIRDKSDDPAYWEEVMEVIPSEPDFVLSLLEISEAVCTWLRDVVEEGEDEDENEDAGQEEEEKQNGTDTDGGRSHSVSPRFSLEKSGSESVTPPITPKSAAKDGRRKFARASTFGGSTFDAKDAVTPQQELTRAQDLAEILQRAVAESGDVASIRALDKLKLAHDALERGLQQQDADLKELRSRSDILESTCNRYEEELRNSNELNDDSLEKSRQLEEYRRRADHAEQDASELREHLQLATQEVTQLREKVEQADRDQAEAKRKEYSWQETLERLEETEAKDTAQIQSLQSELQAKMEALEALEKLKSDVGTAQLESDLAACKEREQVLRSQVEAAEEEQRRLQAAEKERADEVAKLEEQLKESKEQEEKLRLQHESKSSAAEEVKEANDALVSLQAVHEEKLQELSKLQEELASSMGRENSSVEARESQQAQLKEANASLAKLKEELAGSKAREEGLRSQLQNANDLGNKTSDERDKALEEKLAENVQLQEEVASSRAREEDLRSRLEAAEAELQAKEAEHSREETGSKEREEHLRSQIAAAEADRKRLAELQAADEERSGELTKLKEALAESAAREEDLRKQHDDASDHQQQLTAGQAELARINEELQESTAREKDLRSQVAAAEAERDKMAELQAASHSREEELRSQLSDAEAQCSQLAELEEQLAASRAREEVLRSGAAKESETDDSKVQQLRKQVATLEIKVQSQQDQLKRVRAARDEMLRAQEEFEPDEEELSPRRVLMHRNSSFLTVQLKILKKHLQEVEQALDNPDGKDPSATEARQASTLQRLQDESSRTFNELSEKLYTLEVQKTDADEEVRRLQAIIDEKEGQIRSAQILRKELLAEVDAAKEREKEFQLRAGRGSASSVSRSVEGYEIGKAGTVSATSDTRSGGTSSPVHRGTPASSSSDPGGFLGPSKTTSELKSSPKGGLQTKRYNFYAETSDVVTSSKDRPKVHRNDAARMDGWYTESDQRGRVSRNLRNSSSVAGLGARDQEEASEASGETGSGKWRRQSARRATASLEPTRSKGRASRAK